MLEGSPPKFQNCSLKGKEKDIHSTFRENILEQDEAIEERGTTDGVSVKKSLFTVEIQSVAKNSIRLLHQYG